MSISGIEGLGALGQPGALGALGALGSLGGVGALDPSGTTTGPAGVTAAAGGAAPVGPAFGKLLADGITGLEGLNDRTDRLRVQAATGDLGAIHDYTLAATEASVATQLTVAVRNKAIEAFQDIMRMQVG